MLKTIDAHIADDNNPPPPPPVGPIALPDTSVLIRLNTEPPTAASPSSEAMANLRTMPVALTPTRTTTLLLSSTTSSPIPSLPRTQVRHATFIARPRRPYTFTQLITLSDGSAYTMRTTSPQPIYRASKDTRNTLLWQPSEKSLKNVELDEAGKLAAFRERYGRAYDAGTLTEEGGEDAAVDEGYADLITGYAPAQETTSMKDSGPKKQAKKRK